MMQNSHPEKRIQRGSLNTQWSNLNWFKCQCRSHIPPWRKVPPNRENASTSYSTFTCDLLDSWECYIQAPLVPTVVLHLMYGEPRCHVDSWFVRHAGLQSLNNTHSKRNPNWVPLLWNLMHTYLSIRIFRSQTSMGAGHSFLVLEGPLSEDTHSLDPAPDESGGPPPDFF